MPIYTYKCTNCGVREDRLTSVSKRDDARDCVVCEGEVKRQIDVPGWTWGPSRSQ